MLRPSALLLLLALTLPGIAGAQGSLPPPADFLPPGSTVLQAVDGDVDGDGRVDAVALYSVRPLDQGAAPAGLLVLLNAPEGARPVHLFGEPPGSLRGEPTLDPTASAELALADLTGDGQPEIVLRVASRIREPRGRAQLWVFGRRPVAAPVADDEFAVRKPTWAGTGFRLEAFLEGSSAMILPPPAGAAGPATLRREVVERRLAGPAPAVTVTEIYGWRDDGFRLSSRSLRLPDGSGDAGSAEAAVLAFYGALAEGNMAAATDLLDADLQGERAARLMAGLAGPARELNVEEIRLVGDDRFTGRPRAADHEVFVRVSVTDLGPGPSPGPDLATFAGTWRVRQAEGRWLLAEPRLQRTARLSAVADALPPGATPLQIAGGDLRGQGVEDLAVLAQAPGRYAPVEPYALLARPGGFEPAVPLAAAVPDSLLGGPGGTVSIVDVNGDGAAELVFNGPVGAHAAVLWVLRWDGARLAPLFAETSNSPTIGLRDLDDDGIPEVVLGQSGYCGSYAASPRLTFAFRWDGDAYRPASWRYPLLQDGVDAHAAALLGASPGGGSDDARACVRHLLATAHALQARPADARAAYRAYAEVRRQLAGDARRFVRPAYLGAPYVADDLRALLSAAESGPGQGWGPAELAVLHDLLGDALTEQANGQLALAESLTERGKPDRAREARRRASEARQQATRAYEAALALDPTDDEAGRALGR